MCCPKRVVRPEKKRACPGRRRPGQEEPARATVARLREAVKQPPWANDEEAQAFLGETESLLQGAKR